MPDIRSFIAVEMPQAILAKLATMQQLLRGEGAQVAWVRLEGLHVTLKFLGYVPAEQIAAIGDALAGIAERHRPFRLSVARIGGFPSPRRPRVVWAGVEAGVEEMSALAREVEDAMAALGFAREERPFQPHLTLGRVKAPEGIERLAAAMGAHAEEQFGEARVAEMVLMRSDLSPQGAHYTALRRVPLLGKSGELAGNRADTDDEKRDDHG